MSRPCAYREPAEPAEPFLHASHSGIIQQIVSLGDSRIERVRGRLAILSMLKVRVVDLEYS